MIDLKTKKEILQGINIAHDDLEKLGVVSDITKGQGRIDHPIGPPLSNGIGNGSVSMVYAPAMEERNPDEGSNAEGIGSEGSSIPLPKRNRRIANPGISETGKRVGTRTVAKVPKEDT